MINKIAQIQIAPDGGFKGFGPLGLEQGQVADNVFAIFISSAIGLIGIIAIIWFIFIVVTSGIAYMNAGSDAKATEGARKKITNGIIGLLVTIFGIFIIRLIGQIFNLPDILSVGKLIEQTRIK